MTSKEAYTMNVAKKNDKGKLRFDLINPEFTKAVAGVLTFGAEKYGPNSWQNLEDPVNRYYAALLRHLNAFHSGEAIDKESGLSHLAHAATNIMFLMHFTQSESKKPELVKEDIDKEYEAFKKDFDSLLATLFTSEVLLHGLK